MPQHKVKKGDCISSIAMVHGFLWKTLWGHSENSELRSKRKEPNILQVGDIVFIPEKEQKEESIETEATHSFVKKGVLSKFRLKICKYGEPRAGLSYKLKLDGKLIAGTTDSQGVLEHPMPPNTKQAELTIEGEQPIQFILGGLDPIETISGIQARLLNLDYDLEKIDNKLGTETKEALKLFQLDNDLESTGEPDDKTRDTLKNVHGC